MGTLFQLFHFGELRMDHKPSELVQRYALSASKVSPVSLTTIEWPLIDVILVSNRFMRLTPLYLLWNISFCQMWASSLVSSQAYPEVSLLNTYEIKKRWFDQYEGIYI